MALGHSLLARLPVCRGLMHQRCDPLAWGGPDGFWRPFLAARPIGLSVHPLNGTSKRVFSTTRDWLVEVTGGQGLKAGRPGS